MKEEARGRERERERRGEERFWHGAMHATKAALLSRAWSYCVRSKGRVPP